MSAYLVFLERYRDAEMKLHPELKMADIIKKLAEKWRVVTDEEKAECEAKAKEDKDRYEMEMKNYTPPPPLPSLIPEVAALGKKYVDPNEPKKPYSAYVLFSMTYREELKHKNGNAATLVETNKALDVTMPPQAVGEAWRLLSADEKSKYVQKAKEDRDVYLRDKAAYDAVKMKAEAAVTAHLPSMYPALQSLAAFHEAGSKATALGSPLDEPSTMQAIRTGLSGVAKEDAYYKVVELRRTHPELVWPDSSSRLACRERSTSSVARMEGLNVFRTHRSTKPSSSTWVKADPMIGRHS
eukprot:scaffold3036_cov414-Prasinococcus_capsulatus_cf.AAC.2